MFPADVEGSFVDVGSGNGYPGLVLGAARPGLSAVLADASVRKTAFLRAVIEDAGFKNASVLESQIQRAADLDGDGPFRLITARALGGWPKILPRLRTCLAEGGDILVWAGDEVETIIKREVWKKLRLEEKHPLPAREKSWIWRFRAA